MNPQVDKYLSEGCGRCPLGGTPDCKVHPWAEELQELRSILLSTQLKEEVKWGGPCYTHEGNNVVMLGALKDAVVVGFFKGSLLADESGLLVSPGPRSQAVRQFRFTDIDTIHVQEPFIRTYVQEAIELEKAGRKVNFNRHPEPMPAELEEALSADADFNKAFHALTPGRQRGYILHISDAKQSTTRMARIEKHKPNILAGKGMQDR